METVEQRLVVDESKDLVDRAREQLSMVDPLRLRKNFSRNSARWILHKQEDVIDELQREGKCKCKGKGKGRGKREILS